MQKTARMKIPFGIAQTGKAFRNEIVARQFIFRMREFEQMEMQFFVQPGTELEWYENWKKKRLEWHYSLGFPAINTGFKTIPNWPTMLMLPAILNLNFLLGLKKWKASIPVPILT